MHTDVMHFIELLWGMTEKELRARYKNTVFGFLWLVVNPLLQMIIIGFIFPLFVKETIANYNLYLLIGLLAWNFFSLSFAKATPSLVHERFLIKKSAFPRAVIPMSIILSNFINYLAAFALFSIPLALLKAPTIGSLFLFAGTLILLLLFTIGISLLTSALNVRYRDVNFFVQALLIIWFYATPIVYSLSHIPASLLWVWNFNPLASIIQLMQYALIGSPSPQAGTIWNNILMIALLLVLGIVLFRKESKSFDDWL